MKKLLFALTIIAFTACNDSADSTEEVVDSTADAMIDSVEVRADSVQSAIDSSADATIDSLPQ